ncbi:metallophosphoesterase [Microcoleus sp. FACHB-1515]|uniref:metallophosphoesterase n=1 Tax=Cyanophyceae TaxID=3028117 RepID=UPI001682793B|nr:metallophosphoesterase [Microcoleus sp. FACHB-1515]MBD2089550.1 metallophosphoesterase [Microcoleus sp. FACHB-1515]
MQFVTDPPIALKIRKMRQRVRWQDPVVRDRGIDQTRLVLDNGTDDPEFSFLVVGDSGSGGHRGHNPQRRIAELMLAHRDAARFVLHTGDVIYLVGSSEYYPSNFIEPYREFLVGGDNPKRIAFDQMVFNQPFLPIPGNHDYYDLPLAYGFLAQAAQPLRYLLRSRLDFDIGWHGSEQGKAYTRAFIDSLDRFLLPGELERHLDRHYTAQTETGRCLRYEPGSFTRLPNRYYTFRCGGVDFFAIDSNTFNDPDPLESDDDVNRLRARIAELEGEKQALMAESTKFDPNVTEEADRLDDIQAKIQQLDEMINDIEKQMKSDREVTVDTEQLDWLKDRLIASWQNPDVRGRVIFFHHPPYVTEATKWYQAQTLAIRHRLRRVLNAVSIEVEKLAGDRPLVDLVLNGHAHCLEYLRTGDTGHADSNMNWIVCGGSGYSLRRQREEGADLMEEGRMVARSKLFVGRNGQGSFRRRPYSFLRIDVKPGTPPRFVVRPGVAERFQGKWNTYNVDPFEI